MVTVPVVVAVAGAVLVPPTGAVVVAAATVVEVTGTVVVLVVLGDPGPELTNTLGAPERPGSAGPAASPSPP